MGPILTSHNSLLSSMPESDLGILRSHLKTVDLIQGTVLVAAGEPVTEIVFPHSGVISLVVSLSNGDAVEVAMIGRDSIFGSSAALDGNISLTDAIVQLPGTASILSVRRLRQLADMSHAFRTALVRHEQALFAQAQQSAACNAFHSVEARLARWLLRMRDLTGNDDLPLTQDFLAQMIGVHRSSVSGVAHELQAKGRIQYNRGHIRINDQEGLEEVSCECYLAVKIQYDRLMHHSGNLPSAAA
jgi:CRP-like cAMP-binding protein